MNISKLETVIVALQTIQVWAKVIMYFFLAWLLIETFIHIDNHGLKSLIELIWEGPSND